MPAEKTEQKVQIQSAQKGHNNHSLTRATQDGYRTAAQTAKNFRRERTG